MAEAKRDQNMIVTLLGVSNADGITPVVLWADPVTHRLLVSAASSAHSILSASHDDSVVGTVVLGDIIIGNSTPKWERLAGNTTTTKKFLVQTGNGVISAAPAWDILEASDIPDISAYYATQAQFSGKENYHGVQAYGALSFDDSTHILSVASITYWYQGVKYTTAGPVTCDIDSFETLTANTVYFFYFDDASGTLKCSTTFFNYHTQIPIANVIWNGSAGAINIETHSHTRDIDWHIWAHETIGTMYQSGLTLTNPTTINDALLQIETGEVHDEDIKFITGQQTTCRIFYQVSAGVYTWVSSSLPYAGTSGAPKFLDTDTYTLSTYANGDYAVMWVYVTDDKDRPIYIIPTHASVAHTTLNSARAETPPLLSGLNISPEMKLIYKFIYAGNGQFQESTDYRSTRTIPGGGVGTPTAGGVSFTPTGNISATSVQGAIEELDAEKAPIASPTFQTSINGAFLNASEILITDGSKNIVSAPIATYPSLVELAYLKGVTSAIQTQIGTKAPSTAPTFATSITGSYLTASEMLITDADKKIVSAPVVTYPSLTELSYVKGLTSAIQTQLGAKLPLAGGTMTGDIVLADTVKIKVGTGTGDVAEILLNSSALADEHYSGITIDATAGATLAVGDVVFLDVADSQWKLQQGILDGTDTSFAMKLGICVLAANDNGATKILLRGLIASAAFPTFTVGAKVYLSDTAGDMDVTQPSTTNFAIRVLGEAISATVLDFNPSNDWIVHI